MSNRRTHRLGWALAALALFSLTPLTAGAAEDRAVPPGVVAQEHVSGTAADDQGVSQGSTASLETALDALEPPAGFGPVSLQVYGVTDDEGSEPVTIAEAKFNGPSRSAATVLIIDGATWNLERELAVSGERAASEVEVAGRAAVLVIGGSVLSLAWGRPDGRIIQIVVRGDAMSRDALIEYATALAGNLP